MQTLILFKAWTSDGNCIQDYGVTVQNNDVNKCITETIDTLKRDKRIVRITLDIAIPY